jgi:hypothetical protein
MKYAKPEVNCFADASEAIQGSMIKMPPVAAEVFNGPIVASSPAYEADE